MSRGAASVAPSKHSKKVGLSGCVRLQPVTVLSCQRGSFATCRTASSGRISLYYSNDCNGLGQAVFPRDLSAKQSGEPSFALLIMIKRGAEKYAAHIDSHSAEADDSDGSPRSRIGF